MRTCRSAIRGVYLPMRTGRRLVDLPEVTALAEPGGRASFTLISLDGLGERAARSTARQNATAVAADAAIGHLLGCDRGQPVLDIDCLYRDSELTPLEYAVSHLHPDRWPQ